MDTENNVDVKTEQEVKIVNLLEDNSSDSSDGGCCGGSCNV